MNFNYQLKLSRRRKTVAITVKRQGVVVHAPYGICHKWLNAWLETKQEWVEKKLAIVAKKRELGLEPLKSVNVYGESYKLIFDSESRFIDHMNKCIYLTAFSEGSKDSHIDELNQLFQVELTNYLQGRLPYFQTCMGSKYKVLKVRFYKRRWGSLSSKGVLAFNSALLGAPKWVIDYVIVHELAHYHVMAHNHAFWQIVARFYPEFEKAKNYLKNEMHHI
ncbi:M48 family metallopeptidase [Pseudoalteromonas luteoviolacea]|uniref:M48 family metallopeptidase n=1 Tax=Pseudoalteromonas luteoviolacea TaxID=43657 RepID=UPI001F31A94D|nr:YgjP-like metallopeptidase domain-containing protein [Pseudoalteromonas luteoviolacea]MCF6442096.1 M48 family metallopeptidase [Pseudoalteromonas luteoviolacea]